MNRLSIVYDYQAFANQRAGGVSRYFYELIRHSLQLEGVSVRVLAGCHRNLYLREAPAAWRHMVTGIPLPDHVPVHPAVSALNRVFFACARRAIRPDLYHLTYFNWLQPHWNVRRVVTVFDMTHEIFPAYHEHGRDPTACRKRYAVQHARGVICISEQTRRDLLERVNVPEDRVRVIHLATDIDRVPSAPLSVTRPYFLYVGNRGRYKNFPAVLGALAASRALDSFDLQCFGGEPVSESERRQMEVMRLSGRVTFRTGPDQLLAALYRQAVALVYPSRYEGFGLPPLEAMKLGCPALVGRCGAVEEVVGEAGLYFDPLQPEEIRERMERVAADAALRRALAEKGFLRARLFDWMKCARETVDFYRVLMQD